MTVTKRRIDKIMNYLMNKYPENTFFYFKWFDKDVVSHIEIFVYSKESPEVHAYVFSLNIRLTKKRYQEIEKCLGLLKEVIKWKS